MPRHNRHRMISKVADFHGRVNAGDEQIVEQPAVR
jgi:hypothetical protein